jgi:hypothetical protein
VIIPQLPDASAAGVMGGGFTYAPIIDNRGADLAAVTRLETVLGRQAAEFEGRVKQIVRTQGRKWK